MALFLFNIFLNNYLEFWPNTQNQHLHFYLETTGVMCRVLKTVLHSADDSNI